MSESIKIIVKIIIIPIIVIGIIVGGVAMVHKVKQYAMIEYEK